LVIWLSRKQPHQPFLKLETIGSEIQRLLSQKKKMMLPRRIFQQPVKLSLLTIGSLALNILLLVNYYSHIATMTTTTNVVKSPVIPPVTTNTPSAMMTSPRKLSRLLRMTGYKPGRANDPSPVFKMGYLPEYDTVIDVGAYDCKDYTLPGFKAGYVVFTFEVDISNQNRCLRKLKENGLVEGYNLTIIEVKPGEIPKPVDFDPINKRPHIYFFKAGISNKVGGVTVGWAKELATITGQGNQTAVIPLDSVIPSKAKVMVLKSDTQGHEYGVFSGATEILKRGMEVIFLEYWPNGAKYHGFESVKVLELLYDLGYRCFDTGFHRYNKVTRPSEIHEYTQQLIDQQLTVDALGSWDDVVCI
jgi:FkbM family methyltransferase